MKCKDPRLKLNSKALKDITIPEMEALRDQVAEDRDQIKGQLEIARARQKSEGVYADPEWYASATGALRVKNRQYNRLLQEISKKKKAQTKGQATSLENAFMTVCKRRMAPEVWEEYLEEARQELSEGNF